MWLCVLTGDPEMSAEQVLSLRFGITSALPSTPNAVFVLLGEGLVWALIPK